MSFLVLLYAFLSSLCFICYTLHSLSLSFSLSLSLWNSLQVKEKLMLQMIKKYTCASLHTHTHRHTHKHEVPVHTHTHTHTLCILNFLFSSIRQLACLWETFHFISEKKSRRILNRHTFNETSAFSQVIPSLLTIISMSYKCATVSKYTWPSLNIRHSVPQLSAARWMYKWNIWVWSKALE